MMHVLLVLLATFLAIIDLELGSFMSAIWQPDINPNFIQGSMNDTTRWHLNFATRRALVLIRLIHIFQFYSNRPSVSQSRTKILAESIPHASNDRFFFCSD
ncbi:hypothetical protein BJ912DRAFT_314843 [Pholiota molesta]|nr:hypothetical protein BJ912DRAFT_314843 [Pholiota molesta]